MGVVAAYGQILGRKLLDLPPLGLLNLHPSLLPRWRGAAPIQRALLAGDAETGVCVMRVAPELDAGAVLARRSLAIGSRDTSADLHEKLAELGAGQMLAALYALENGEVTEVPQDESLATYAEKLRKEEAKLDWRLAAVRLDRLVRGLKPLARGGNRLARHCGRPGADMARLAVGRGRGRGGGRDSGAWRIPRRRGNPRGDGRGGSGDPRGSAARQEEDGRTRVRRRISVPARPRARRGRVNRNAALSGKGARSPHLVRRAAHAALLSFEKSPVAADVLVERFASNEFDARDRAFLRELVYGVLRRRSRLDFVFGRFLNKPNVAPPVREALRLGAYQLLFMDRVPAHGAVDGAVSLLDRKNTDWARGLVNAVLRKVAAREVEPPEDIEDYLAVWESHPRWLVRRWLRALGDVEARRRCLANNEEAPVVFRVNTRSSDARSLAAELAGEGVATRPGCADPDCLVFLPGESARGARFSDTAAYGEGKFIVMDESSSLVSRFAGAAPGESVLDACAAPGGKTACLVWAAGDGGCVVAGEASPRRLALLQRNCVRIRADARLLRMDAVRPPFHRAFDLVLVDAPCSGLGVFRRHPDARWRLQERDLASQAKRQKALLRGAARAVRPGGRLVYSVCANEPEETEEVAASFREPGFVPMGGGSELPECAGKFLGPDGSLRIPPGDGLDGFFAMSWRNEGGRC